MAVGCPQSVLMVQSSEAEALRWLPGRHAILLSTHPGGLYLSHRHRIHPEEDMIHCVGTEDLEPGGNFAMGRKGQFLRGSPVGLRVCQLGSIHGPPCHQCEEHLGGELVWFSRPADLGPQRWVLRQDSWRFILREVVPFGRMKEVPRQVVAHPLGAGRLKWLKPGPDIHQDTSTMATGTIRWTPCPR